MDLEDIHQKVLKAKNKDELAKIYADWAKTYDKNLLDSMGYVAPKIAANLLMKYINDKDALILDAGCGTGLVGEYLHSQGFHTIHGLDYSNEMLDQARKKNVYNRLDKVDLTRKLDISDNSYSSLICVGTLTLGHVGPSVFSEFIRICKPGAYICFTVRAAAWDSQNYKEVIETHKNKNHWEEIEISESDYILSDESKCKLCVFRTC